MPMELGEPARKGIKGNNLDYYLNILRETRESTLAEFRNAMTPGSWRSTKRGVGSTKITASGSTSLNTKPITTAKSNL